MDLREALQSRMLPVRFRPDAVARERLERVLAAAAGTPSFADQHPIRLLVVEDADTKRALRGACEAQRERWFVETADWVAAALEGAGERRQLVALTDAPHVVCIFGEIEKPGWREAAWTAAERLRLAAGAENLAADVVRLEQFGFLNVLLDVPESFSGVALLAVGEPESVQPATAPAPRLDDLLLRYEPQPERLVFWDDPVRLGTLAQSRQLPQRSFVSDKLLLLRVIQMAGEVNTCTDLDSAFRLVTEGLRRILRYDRASIAFHDPEDGLVRLRNVYKEIGLPLGENQVVPLDEGNVIGWVMLNRAGVCRNQIAKEEVFAEQVSGECLQSDMVVPLVADGCIFGTLNVGCYQPNAFTASDFEIVREFGKLLGTAVERLQDGHWHAAYDRGTGVFGPQRFQTQLAQEIERCRQHGLQCALLLVHLDRLPGLKEKHGHDVGDRVLASVARAIRESVRDIDVVARFGDEEFAVLLPETGSEAMAVVAERIRSAVETRLHALDDSKLPVRTSVSIGGGLWTGGGAEVDLVAQACAALGRAQRDGCNRYRHFDPAADLGAAGGRTA
jgi:diguanylate cyclase (GGDEF)-like protein